MQNDLQKKFSKENLENRLIQLVKDNIRSNIKTIIFKANSKYDDEYDYYNPVLILIDENFTEIDHKVPMESLYPSRMEQADYYNEVGKILYIPDLTIKL